MAFQDELIVLKEIHYKDYDKILHCFSRKMGKIQIMARQSRKNNHENMALAQVFNHVQVQLNMYRDMYQLTNGQVLNSFYDLRKDYNGYILASYIFEILLHILQENEPNIPTFDMTIKLLTSMTKKPQYVEKLITAYEMKLACLLGYRPQLRQCIDCGDGHNPLFFSVADGGVICGKCHKERRALSINHHQINQMTALINVRFEDIERIDGLQTSVQQLIRQYLHYHIGKNNFKSLKMIQ